MIDNRRREVVEKVVAVLDELVVSFRDGPDECSFDCSSAQLGALIKEMRAKRLDLKPETPLIGYSIGVSVDRARMIRSPSSVCPRQRIIGPSWGCNLKTRIQSKVDGLEEGVGGLTLDDFVGRRSLHHPRS